MSSDLYAAVNVVDEPENRDPHGKQPNHQPGEGGMSSQIQTFPAGEYDDDSSAEVDHMGNPKLGAGQGINNLQDLTEKQQDDEASTSDFPNDDARLSESYHSDNQYADQDLHMGSITIIHDSKRGFVWTKDES
jgi:hypothetical protein